jgi:hypothetical protein
MESGGYSPVIKRPKHGADHLLPSSAEDKNKAIPVAGRGGPYGCETSRLPHYLDNRLSDGGEVK